MMTETVLSRSLRLVFSGGIAVGLGLAALPAVAQTASQDNSMQRVEITGSSIKRVAAETAMPITILRREDIDRTGATSAQDLVNLIPGNFGGNVASNNVGASGVPSTANLRALGARYTLVLLNGRRVANYAVGNNPVDLNSIPLSAIERIEVLRDGASAVYGADAVAGVINFILKKDYNGMEVSAYKTHVDQGGGNTTSFNLTGGFGDLATDRFNVLFSANHEENDKLRASDRSFSTTAVRPDLSINKSSPRNGVPNLNFTDSRGNKYVGVNPYRYNGCKNDEFSLVVISEKGCGTDYVKYIDLVPEAKHDNIVTRAVFKVNEGMELFAEAAYTKDKMIASASPAPYTKPMSYPANGRFYPKTIKLPKGLKLPAGYKMPDGTVTAAETVLAADMDVTPTGPMSGTWRTVAGGGRNDLTKTENTRIVVGAKGNLAGWDYETALTYGKNEVEIQFGPGKFSYAKLKPLVDSGEINVFGTQDEKSLAGLLGSQLSGFENGGTSTSKEFDFKMSKELFNLPAGAVGFSVGTSYRKEKLTQVSSDVLKKGDEVGGAGEVPGVTGDRQVYGLFSEVIVPVVKGLELSGAARYDKYKNGFGTQFDNLSPKLSLTYRPSNVIMGRASVARGFRAPTLVDNLNPKALNNTSSNFSDPVRCPNGKEVDSVNKVGDLQDECNVQLTTQNSGNPDLKPEKSKQYTLGLVFQPTSTISGSIDYWNVKIEKSINAMSENTVFGDPVANVNQFYRYDPSVAPGLPGSEKDPIRGSTNKDFPLAYVALPRVNTGKFYAAGIDLNLNYRQKMGDMGTVGANYDSTYYSKHGYQYEGSPEVSDLGNYKDFGPTPRYRHMLTLNYGLGQWSASVTHNYTKGYWDYTDPASIRPEYPELRKVGAYSTFDATLGWKPMKNVSMTVGVKNIADQDPPSSRNESNFQVGYDPTFTNPLGRTFYARLNYKFL
ncbi:TonB-dependent receptor; Outer membrane receptor for ferrienterochelin and colicins [Janthinobacterium sp. CG23_2]|nr:TonB-dependent receptor; Outer membrane receptor for ferrienterochelin and colicins [Janthinobacterium sp. CG23_2]CUU31518.1 TonB-dependent receptor; Outer membrane receptor for ferrienterochelin and colicins [Janthinobacterium sp. CG23_2]